MSRHVHCCGGPRDTTLASCDLTVFGAFYEKFRVDNLLQEDNKYAWGGDVGGLAVFPLQNEVLHSLAEHQFPDLRWDVLRPVMQVASKLLLSPGSEEYLYAAFMSKLRDVPYADDQPDGEYDDNKLSKTYKSLFRKGVALNANESKAIELRLQQMATWVTFGMGDTESCGLEGYCEPQEFAKVKGDPGDWRGVASHIVLNENGYKLYCELYDATGADSPQEQKDRLHRLAFRVAVTTCHELAHAFRFARFSSDKIVSIGFETQCISEEGFDWETCVFGGSMQSCARSAEVTEWPSARTFDAYFRAGGLHMMFVARRPEHDVSVSWKVPDAYIRSMFQPSTWKKKVREHGIRVPKLLGYRAVPCAHRGVCQCFTCQKTEMLVEAHIECGNGEFDIQKHDEKVVALLRSLTVKQSVTPDPLLQRMQTRKLAADTFENLDDDQSCQELDPDKPHLYSDCVREPWGEYPFGGRQQRRHVAASFAMAISKGFVSLLDGTLVPSDKAPILLRRERKVMERDIRKARDLLHRWDTEQSEGFPGDRSESEEMLRARRLMPVVMEMVESEDAVVRRMVSGIEEVQSFET